MPLGEEAVNPKQNSQKHQEWKCGKKHCLISTPKLRTADIIPRTAEKVDIFCQYVKKDSSIDTK